MKEASECKNSHTAGSSPRNLLRVERMSSRSISCRYGWYPKCDREA